MLNLLSVRHVSWQPHNKGPHGHTVVNAPLPEVSWAWIDGPMADGTIGFFHRGVDRHDMVAAKRS
jgi:hypothetical protein